MRGWKGLLLAGGTGSRLYPVTTATNKHLLPVYDKPMIFYPLTTLMFAGIREIVIVTGSDALPQFRQLLGDGRQWGLKLSFRVQDRPGGIAEGFRIARSDLEGSNVALILGDNIFYGSALGAIMRGAAAETQGATLFSYEVADPSAFGVVTLDATGRPVSIEEKPAKPSSRHAVTGLYFYDRDVLEIAASLKPSGRGELEITDVNRAYLEQGRLAVKPLGRGIAWLDGGTSLDLFEASQFVKVIEERTGLKIACPEEVALRLGYVSLAELRTDVQKLSDCSYKTYLATLVKEWRTRPA
jgi:glucose-1-phosphate thymidylyltransferase